MATSPGEALGKVATVELLASIAVQDVLAHGFFIAAGVALGVRAADDLLLLKERRAAKQLAADR